MIAVDTSALMAILLEEPQAAACAETLAIHDQIAISAATLAEALVVADRRGYREELMRLTHDLQWEVAAVTADVAEGVAQAYARWGKGRHPARLNFADCFAYELAARLGWPLLYVGRDFARTDIKSALARPLA